MNFEDERLAGLSAEHLHPLVENYYRRHPETRGRKTVTWCLDEIQVVPGWERFVRRLLDTEQVEIFVTGSSAALLSREIATALRGRAWEVLLHPFRFDEALRHQGATLPEAQGLEVGTRRQLLRDYVDVAMLRDVVERHGVTNVAGLRWLVRHLLGNAAGVFSVEKFYGALRSQVPRRTPKTGHAWTPENRP